LGLHALGPHNTQISKNCSKSSTFPPSTMAEETATDDESERHSLLSRSRILPRSRIEAKGPCHDCWAWMFGSPPRGTSGEYWLSVGVFFVLFPNERQLKHGTTHMVSLNPLFHLGWAGCSCVLCMVQGVIDCSSLSPCQPSTILINNAGSQDGPRHCITDDDNMTIVSSG